MRKAVIDLGTNTFNLLIAEVNHHGLEIVHSEKEGVALGMGGINQNVLAPDAYERGIRTLTRFKKVCDDLGAVEIRGIGTSALRDASNATQFIEQVQQDLGIRIEIVTGHREAELIYQGVKWTYDFEEPAVIMDIGGGSTEFVFADKKGINDLISLNIGVSRIYQHFKCADPMSEQDVAYIEQWLEEKANGFFDGKEEHILIGASGSFETFYELIHNEPFPSKLKAVEISVDYLRDCLDQIIATTQAERDANDWIIPIRKKMAPIAAVKVRWVLNKLNIKRTYISPCSLKEGALT
jgi:exopolyphosphatase/guanosine-5'-triphosphate,3'-diphosphate pyrophosphatase